MFEKLVQQIKQNRAEENAEFRAMEEAKSERNEKRLNPDKKLKVVIVGAGVAGLAAGIYALQSAFDVTIYERQDEPGGVCAGIDKDGYHFHIGPHWVEGLGPGLTVNRMWTELGALNEDVFLRNHEPYYAYEADGQAAFLYRRPNIMCNHLTEVAPEDGSRVKKLCRDSEKIGKVDLPFNDVNGLMAKNVKSVNHLTAAQMTTSYRSMPKYAKQSMDDFTATFRNEFLTKMFRNVVGASESVVSLVNVMAQFTGKNRTFIDGGPRTFTNNMAREFKRLGGKLYCGRTVERVVLQNDVATSVIVDDKKVKCDAVIVAQDAITAAFSLFEPPLKEDWVYSMATATKPMVVTEVCLGVKADMSALPEIVGFELEHPITVADREYTDLTINNYAGYDECAPEGCTALTVPLHGDTYDWWIEREEDGTYKKERENVAKTVIAALEQKYPDIAGNVETYEVLTPLTFESKYRGFRGSEMSVLEPETDASTHSAKPEGIDRLYFAGHRMLLPGGMANALKTARVAVQYLCVDTETVFQSQLPSEEEVKRQRAIEENKSNREEETNAIEEQSEVAVEETEIEEAAEEESLVVEEEIEVESVEEEWSSPEEEEWSSEEEDEFDEEIMAGLDNIDPDDLREMVAGILREQGGEDAVDEDVMAGLETIDTDDLKHLVVGMLRERRDEAQAEEEETAELEQGEVV